jgi:hypothetical protein
MMDFAGICVEVYLEKGLTEVVQLVPWWLESYSSSGLQTTPLYMQVMSWIWSFLQKIPKKQGSKARNLGKKWSLTSSKKKESQWKRWSNTTWVQTQSFNSDNITTNKHWENNRIRF